MEQNTITSFITANKVNIDQTYIDDKGGILNALTFASAQYIYKVLEKYSKTQIKWFDLSKSKRLKRTILHKNAHLDEYFAELIFRAILPPHLKDIEVCEHVLMSREDDSYAKVSWPNGVVFGIHSDESGGAKALSFFDEHNNDGSRIKPSCSQLIAEEYLGTNIPSSIQKVLDEVNFSDSLQGAHQFNLKNIFFAMHDILFVIGKDEINDKCITKYLTENWKRAIVDSCMTAMIFVYENRLLSNELDESEKEIIERATKKSLDFFLSKSMLNVYSPSRYYEKVKGDLLFKFKVWSNKENNNNNWHKTIDGAVWKDEENGDVIGQQILILQVACYALNKCWGENIANFIMMHIWQALFQQQISFHEVKDEIIQITESEKKGNTNFGYVEKIILNGLNFKPQQNEKDKRKRKLNLESPLWIYDVSVTNPNYPNVATVLKSIINDDYPQKGNNGFGLFILHDKTINSKIINNGQTIPYNIWVQFSKKIVEAEPDCWFQLINLKGKNADFILNRSKAHQEPLPSSLVDKDFIIDTLKKLS